MLASAPWYTSGAFWGAAGAVVGLAAAVIILVTWRIGAPRRLLTYSTPLATSLLTTHSRRLGLVGEGRMEVTYGGKQLSNPYLTVLTVDSRSRRDIRSSDFDQDKPLVFDIGAPIIAVVGGSTSIETPVEVVTVVGSRVELKPFLIRRGKVLRLSILTEGPPRLSCNNPLIDVKVEQETEKPARSDVLFIVTVALVVGGLVCVVLIAASIKSGPLAVAFATPFAVGGTISAFLAFDIAKEARSRRRR